MKITTSNMQAILLHGSGVQSGAWRLKQGHKQILDDLRAILETNGHLVKYERAYDPIAEVENKIAKLHELWNPLHGPMKAWMRDVDNANKGYLSRTQDVNDHIAWQRARIERHLDPYLASCLHLAEDLGSTVL